MPKDPSCSKKTNKIAEMKFLIFLIFFTHQFCFAEEQVSQKLEDVKKSDYQIDSKYKAGEYLIFDCESNHFACVDLDGSQACQARRETSIAMKRPKLDCANLEKFKDKKLCIEKNYKVVDKNVQKRFCYPK